MTRAADCFDHSLLAGPWLWRHKGRHVSRHCCCNGWNVTLALFFMTLHWIEAKYRLYERELMNISCWENYFIHVWINKIKNKHCQHPDYRMKSTHSFLHLSANVVPTCGIQCIEPHGSKALDFTAGCGIKYFSQRRLQYQLKCYC